MTLNPDYSSAPKDIPVDELDWFDYIPNQFDSDEEWEMSGYPAGNIEDDHGDFCTCIFCIPGA